MEIPIFIYIIIVGVLIALSGLFSATETAFSSANLIRIKQLAKNGDSRAMKSYFLLRDFTSVVTSILICNNVVNILATSIATFVLSELYGEAGVLISTGLMTILVLLFGEITPKIIAKENAEAFVLKLTPFMLLITKILSPLTKIAINVQEHLIDEDDDVTATEEELIQIVQTIEKEGVLDQDERELIESAINFDDKIVREAMRPRIDVTFIFDDADESEILEVIKTHKYSRIPVIDRNNLQAMGIIRERDILECLLNKEEIVISKLIRKVTSVSQRAKLSDVLEQLQKNREHIAIVVENKRNNNFVGIVTLEDVLEELVGEIYDEYDDLPSNVIEIGLHTYEIIGSAPLRQFFDKYLDEDPPKTKCRNFASWVKELSEGKRIKKGKVFNIDNYEIKVLELDGDKVLKVELDVLSKNHDDFEGE